MGIQALCPQPGTSERHPQHKVYPYLLRKVVITLEACHDLRPRPVIARHEATH